MRAASCFSGIGAPELGGPQFNWAWHAEIEKFPAAVMAERFPHSINLGDVTADDFLQRASAFGALDLLAGGPPCQAFSVAGLRRSLDDDRGNLSLRFLEIAHAIRPRNLLVENVPGWLNTTDNAFGCFLAGLVGADDALCTPDGGSWPSAGMVAGPRARAAWRVLDAQYFGLAQRRKRVFLVADFGDGADPAEILFERKSMSGNYPPRRETGQGVAGTISARTKGGGGLGTDFDLDGGCIACADIAPTLNAAFADKQGLEDQHINGGDCLLPPVSLCLNAGAMNRQDPTFETLIPTIGGGFDVAHSLRGEGFDASEDGTGSGTPIVPVAFSSKDYGNDATAELSPTLRSMSHASSHANGGGQMAVAFAQNQRDELRLMDVAGALAAEPGMKQQTFIQHDWAVRRLTPTECERLQGFSDGFTSIPWRGKPAEECPDGPRYKALGNSWATDVGRWIIARLAEALK